MACRFEEFWNAWPTPGAKGYEDYTRKKDRRKSEELWQKRKYDARADVIIRDVEARARYDKGWLSSRGGFLCAPLVYLRNERWEDGTFSDIRDEKRARAKGPPERREIDEGPNVSRYGRYANLLLIHKLCERHGLRDDEHLMRVVARKNELVALAEDDERRGQKWADEDFKDVISKTLDEALNESRAAA